MTQFSMPPTTPGSVMQPHRGVLILVLGILGIVLCFVCGIVAWVMGNGDLKLMAAGQMDPTGMGLTKAGKICGIVGTVLGCIGLLWIVAVFVLGIGMAAAGAAGAGGP